MTTEPTIQDSLRTVTGLMRAAGPGFFVEEFARVHFMQAQVIRAERARADEAEAEVERLKALLLSQ